MCERERVKWWEIRKIWLSLLDWASLWHQLLCAANHFQHTLLMTWASLSLFPSPSAPPGQLQQMGAFSRDPPHPTPDLWDLTASVTHIHTHTHTLIYTHTSRAALCWHILYTQTCEDATNTCLKMRWPHLQSHAAITQSSSVKQAAETEALSGYYMVRIRRSWEWDHIWLNQLALFRLNETETNKWSKAFFFYYYLSTLWN